MVIGAGCARGWLIEDPAEQSGRRDRDCRRARPDAELPLSVDRQYQSTPETCQRALRIRLKYGSSLWNPGTGRPWRQLFGFSAAFPEQRGRAGLTVWNYRSEKGFRPLLCGRKPVSAQDRPVRAEEN